MTVRFACVTPIAAPPEAVFDLSLDIDEHRASMARFAERAIAGRAARAPVTVTTGMIGLGQEVTWRARHFGIPFRMTARIVELHRPTRFVDEQVRGPFRRFRHEHRFEATGAGTRMIDTISFDAPLGPLGQLTERLVLGRYLRDLLAQRNDHLKAAAEGTAHRATQTRTPGRSPGAAQNSAAGDAAIAQLGGCGRAGGVGTEIGQTAHP